MATTNVKKITSITVGGSNKIYGGNIYNFNFQMAFSQKPCEVTINVVSDGTKALTQPKLDLRTTQAVKMGSLDLGDFYPYKIKNASSTANGTTLEVSFVDPSFVLDKIWIGLIGKHGWSNAYKVDIKKTADDYYSKQLGYTDILGPDKDKTPWVNDKVTPPFETNTDSNLFLIGRLFHPCDVNKDNQISPKEDKNVDPCDPCPYCPEDKYETRCFELGQTKIFETAYSFKDLVDNWPKITFPNSVKIGIEPPALTLTTPDGDKPYEKYYRDYHGPLREVLTSWANDFGLFWYYNLTEKKIKFIDISSKTIKVDAGTVLGKYSVDTLVSYEIEESLENTRKIASVSWYEREGERKNFDCSKSQGLALSPLYAADLLGNRQRDSVKVADGKTKSLNANSGAIGGVLGAYYEPLRDAYWIRNVYDLIDANKTASMITTLNMDTGFNEDGSSKQFQSLYEMGDLTILAVISNNLSSTNKKKTKFQELAQYQLENLKAQLTDTEQENFNRNTGYFIVAYQNEDFYQRMRKLEQEMFDFGGRFYVREHIGRMCGITGTEEFVRHNTQIETADGSAGVYSKSEGIDNNPLSKYIKRDKGYLPCVVGSGNLSKTSDQTFGMLGQTASAPPSNNRMSWVQAQGKDYGFGYITKEAYGASPGSEGTKYYDHDQSNFSNSKGSTVPLRLSQSVVILERQPKWVPSVDEFDQYRTKLANSPFSRLSWKYIGSDGQAFGSPWTKAAFGKDVNDVDAQKGALQSGLIQSIKIFYAFPGKFEIKEAKKDHPTDLDIYQKKDYEVVSRRIGGRYNSKTKVGLLSNKCSELIVKIEGDDKIIPKIYTPPFFLGNANNTNGRIIDDQYKSRPNEPCDKAMSSENRPPAYKVIVNQSFNQEVILPKIQTGYWSGTKAPDEVMNFDVSYNSVTNDEFIAFTGYAGYGCVPNLKYLSGINSVYSTYIFDNSIPDKSLRLQIKSLPKLDAYSSEIEKGLNNVSVMLNENGVSSDLYYSTKACKSISRDLIKWKNQTRFSKTVKGH